jgi:hypothetical protein
MTGKTGKTPDIKASFCDFRVAIPLRIASKQDAE